MLYALYYQLGAKSLTSHLKIKTEKKKRLLSTAWPPILLSDTCTRPTLLPVYGMTAVWMSMHRMT